MAYPAPNAVKQNLAGLRLYQLSIYSKPYPSWIGRSAKSVFQTISSQDTAGGVAETFPLEFGMEIIGWIEGSRKVWHPKRFVFVNEAGLIVGLGKKTACWNSSRTPCALGTKLVWLDRFCKSKIPKSVCPSLCGGRQREITCRNRRSYSHGWTKSYHFRIYGQCNFEFTVATRR